ncbi:MAG: hypothetical protein F4X26_05705 [Chloroflexi bacterium]|nr:hypothetical protein [Chloroflexota bacterium]
MSVPPEPRRVRGQPARPYQVRLDAERLGTLLGSVAWVLGALQIMRDRGHAEASEELHDLQEQLTPRLEQLLNDVAVARQAAESDPDSELSHRVEQAYTQVREAFERWIRLTASDTASVAIGQRLAEIAAEGDAEAVEADEPE